MNKEYLRKLARLAVRSGVNVQKGQTVVLNSPVEAVELARLINQEAYLAGAKEVIIRYMDDEADHERYLHADPQIFAECPDWKASLLNDPAADGACYIHIDGDNPALMADINPEYPMAQSSALKKKAALYRSRIDKGEAAWTIVPFAHPDWAKSVYPELEENQAVEALWNDLFAVCRIDENDPVENWEKHDQSFRRRMDRLNALNLKKIHYSNSLGTDLEVELPEGYLFQGGSSVIENRSENGYRFFPNIPTEEIFTAPLKTGVNGIVYSSMPLNHNGALVKNFHLKFKDGAVTEAIAEEGQDVLDAILNTDQNARYLGEAALVPFGSPIQQLSRIFFNTLIDENASCHLALGQSYGECIQNGLKMSKEELEAAGMNQSDAHVDFMIGTPDLKIAGITADGDEVEIFTDGKFPGWIDQD